MRDPQHAHSTQDPHVLTARPTQRLLLADIGRTAAPQHQLLVRLPVNGGLRSQKPSVSSIGSDSDLARIVLVDVEEGRLLRCTWTFNPGWA